MEKKSFAELSYMEKTIVPLRRFCLVMAVAAICYVIWFYGTHIKVQCSPGCDTFFDINCVPFDWGNIGGYASMVFFVVIANGFALYRLRGLGKWYDWCYIFTLINGLAVTICTFYTVPAYGFGDGGLHIDFVFFGALCMGLFFIYIFLAFLVFLVNIFSLLYFVGRRLYHRRFVKT